MSDNNNIKQRVYSLSYGIPDELILEKCPTKKRFLAPYLPGAAYAFGPGQEEEYYQMYRDSMFAMTQKKGGWDCLRHYEIMANGCIPIFTGLNQCPGATMTSFPKERVAEACNVLVPWDESGYEKYVGELLDHTRSKMSCSALGSFFLEKMSLSIGRPVTRVLLLCGHTGTNYLREMLWIGLCRHLSSLGADADADADAGDGVAVEWPRMDFLYSDFPEEGVGKLYGNGFTYSRRLKSGEEGHVAGEWSEERIVSSIALKEWDVVLYGKVGLDEGLAGSVPHLPYWSLVSSVYGRDEIAFLYGEDSCKDMTNGNPYCRHLLEHMFLGVCFVREIRT
jgi:hypothetical protein